MNIEKLELNISGSDSIPMAVDITYVPKECHKLPVVVYAHGINGFKDWGGMPLIAQEFAQAGFIFLKFNFSHNGTTTDHPEEFVDLKAYQEDSYLKRQFDLQQVFTFLEEGHPKLDIDESRISLIGHSRGGPDAILFCNSSRSELKPFKLITWAAVAHARTPWNNLSPEEIKEWQNKGYYSRKNGRTKQDLPISYALYLEYQAQKMMLDIEARAREIEIPWLIVHGEEDEAVFIKDAYILKACQPNAQTFIIPNTGHTFGRKHPLEWSNLPEATVKKVKRSIQFLKEV